MKNTPALKLFTRTAECPFFFAKLPFLKGRKEWQNKAFCLGPNFLCIFLNSHPTIKEILRFRIVPVNRMKLVLEISGTLRFHTPEEGNILN